jgi:signal transduction histidine kinase
MRLDPTLFRSKVAQRIFLLFLFCALLPVTALAVVSYVQVSGQLKEQSQRRLRQATKAAALSIYERLMLLEAEMKMVASNLYPSEMAPIMSRPTDVTEELKKSFLSVTLVRKERKPVSLLGPLSSFPEPSPAEAAHRNSGKAVVSGERHSDLPVRLWMSRAVDPKRPERGLLVAEINPTRLWGGTDDQSGLPAYTELCVLDQAFDMIFCSIPGAASLAGIVRPKAQLSALGEFEWPHDDTEYLASYRSIPLKFSFFIPHWTVVLFESKTDIFAPMAYFKEIFPLVIIAFLGVVVLLSVSQIRRIIGPLEKLRDGTQRIARRDFTSRVTVSSGDEFEELAGLFNAMADRLARQFHTLATIGDIDRAILSVLDTEKIVGTVLQRGRDLVPCDAIAVTVVEPQDQSKGRTHIGDGTRENDFATESAALTEQDLKDLRASPETLSVGPDDFMPAYLAPLARYGARFFLIFPVFFQDKLSAIMILGYPDAPVHDEEAMLHVRQFADQMAIAIYNSQLYQQTRKQAADLEIANKVKDEFLGVMSHELRTPLSVVAGYSLMMKDGMLGTINEEQDRALSLVLKRTNDLLTLISSILDATNIESGALRVIREEVRLGDFLEDLKMGYDIRLKKPLRLHWDWPAELPVIHADGPKLRQILQNLINNAIKFTDQGDITIVVRHAPEEVEFKISDTGVGVPEEALPFIFDKFRQVDGSNARLYEGIGLGLYIVKKFTDLLGGKIDVESAVGKGSTFSLTIPIISTGAAALPTEAPDLLTGAHAVKQVAT